MDEQDFLTSSPTAVAVSGREGSIDEDGGILPVTAGLAKDAALLFQARRFTDCIDLLNQLLQKKEDDPKVLHNIAVAEYFRDGCSDPRKLLDVFNKVKKKSEDLARASGEQVEVVTGNLGSNVITGSKGSGTVLHQFSAANTTSIAYADEFDTSIVTLNTAVVLYHLHDYAHARSMLEQLYRNIEPIDETTALHVCLLLLDIALASRDALKAADVILYLEKAFGVGYMISQVDNGSVIQDLPSNHTPKFSASPNSFAVPDATSSDASASANASENQLVRTLSDDALDYETLLSTLDIGVQNLARPASNDLSRIIIDKPTPAIDLKLKLHLYKVRFLLLTRNLKAAKREVKLAMNIARGRDSSTALLLKSQLEYARGNHRKAVKLLMTSSNRTEAGIVSMFNNNLGCINHRLRKHHLSSVFFSKALSSSSLLRSEKPLKLLTFSQDKSMLIIYNCGLQYLACGRPLDAARCFHKASPAFYKQPLLWLRFAECCLLAQEKGLLKSPRDPSSDDEDVRLKVVGSGKWRHLVVDDVNNSRRNRHLDSMVENGLLFSGNDSYRLSISFARVCLNNALHLLIGLDQEYSEAISSVATLQDDDSSNQAASLGIKNPNSKSIPSGGDSKASSNAPSSVSVVASANGDSKEAKGGLSSNSTTTFQSSVSAYKEMCRKENNMLKQAVLADLAYVELSLERPLKALSLAKELVQLPECSRVYIFLSHVFVAEALCRLNRPKEAAEQLSVYVSDGSSNVKLLPYSDEDGKKWGVQDKCGDEELNASSSGSCSSQTTTTEGQRQGFAAASLLNPEEARVALYVNLTAISAMQGDLEQASEFVTAALSAQPDNPRALLAAVYVDLRLGKTQDALVKLRRCTHVRFIPGGNGTLLSSS